MDLNRASEILEQLVPQCLGFSQGIRGNYALPDAARRALGLLSVDSNLRRAMVYGSVVASVCCEGFGLNSTTKATRAVIEREVPGIAEAMREASRPHTRHWMLSRGVAGIRGRTLIINFPGNPRSIAQTAAAVADALPHALALIADEPSEH